MKSCWEPEEPRKRRPGLLGTSLSISEQIDEACEHTRRKRLKICQNLLECLISKSVVRLKQTVTDIRGCCVTTPGKTNSRKILCP